VNSRAVIVPADRIVWVVTLTDDVEALSPGSVTPKMEVGGPTRSSSVSERLERRSSGVAVAVASAAVAVAPSDRSVAILSGWIA